MISRHSTSNLPSRNQLEFWNEVICKNFTELECIAKPRHAYEASLATWNMQDLQLSMVCADASNVLHTKQLASKTLDDVYLMHLQVAGQSINEQNGNRTVLRPGEFTICSSTRPYSLTFDRKIEMLVLRIPAPLLEKHALITKGDFLGTHFSYSDPMNAALSTLIQSAWRAEDNLQHGTSLSRRVSESVLSLLAVQIEFAAGSQNLEASLSANQAVLLMRIKRYIEQNLSNTELSPSLVAKAVGISDRYMRLLMQSEGTNCARYILDSRLIRVAELLEKSESRSFTLADLAFRWGFNSQAYFTRAFRKKFGLTPTEFQNQQRVDR